MVFMTCVCAIGATVCLIAAFHKPLMIFWIFGIPFAIMTPLMVWQASQPDEFYQRRIEKNDTWIKSHPYLTLALIVTTIILASVDLIELVKNMLIK